MKRRIKNQSLSFVILFFSFFASSFSFAEVIEFHKLTLPRAEMQALPLSVVLVKPSWWEPQDILNEIDKANQVFSQCGFGFTDIEILEFSSRIRALDYSDLIDLMKYLVGIEYPQTDRILVTFLGQDSGRLKEDRLAGFALRSDMGIFSNSAYVLDVMLHPSYWDWKDVRYSLLAHEVSHVLGVNHVTFKNLMAGPDYEKSASLTPQQCETMKKSILIKISNF